MSPFSHYVFLKPCKCPVIIICYFYISRPFMVIDVKRIIMLFTIADQMLQMCVMRCSIFVCLAIVHSTKYVSTLSSSKKYTLTQL